MVNQYDLQYLKRLKQILINNCSKCNGYGTPCECQDQYALEVKKVFANIHPKYRKFTLDMITMKEVQPAKELVQDYISSLDSQRREGRGLYLWSENKGTAKTAFSAIVLIEVLKKGYSAHFTNLDECIDSIMDGWFDQDKKLDFKKNILESEFLVIDDIGGMEIKTKGNKPLITTALTTVFRTRADNLLPTILTSNLTLDQVDREFGERLRSIMSEHLTIVECEGIDYRKHVIAQRKK